MIRLTWLTLACVLWANCLGTNQAWSNDDKREEPRAEAGGPDRERQAHRQELEQRIGELKRRIEELRADNKPDHAAELERQLKNVVAQFQRGEPGRPDLDLLRRKIEDLRRSDRHDEAQKLELELRERAEQEHHRARKELEQHERAAREGGPHRGPGPEELERRIDHLRLAAENLAAAGLHEQAEQLRHQAEAMMRSRSGANREPIPELQEIHNLLRQQNERLERLEQIVHKLMQSSAASSQPAASKKEPVGDARTMAFAQGVIKKYDENGDGLLMKDEWKAMSKDPSGYDFDKDGKITPQEYAKGMREPKK